MGTRLGYIKIINPRLVMVRVTGFGQTGPYKMRPGFGTVAEAFSGFSNVTGEKMARQHFQILDLPME